MAARRSTTKQNPTQYAPTTAVWQQGGVQPGRIPLSMPPLLQCGSEVEYNQAESHSVPRSIGPIYKDGPHHIRCHMRPLHASMHCVNTCKHASVFVVSLLQYGSPQNWGFPHKMDSEYVDKTNINCTHCTPYILYTFTHHMYYTHVQTVHGTQVRMYTLYILNTSYRHSYTGAYVHRYMYIGTYVGKYNSKMSSDATIYSVH